MNCMKGYRKNLIHTFIHNQHKEIDGPNYRKKEMDKEKANFNWLCLFVSVFFDLFILFQRYAFEFEC